MGVFGGFERPCASGIEPRYHYEGSRPVRVVTQVGIHPPRSFGMVYPLVFRRLLLPALDRFNRTSITRVLESLRASESLSLRELRALQTGKLQRLLKYTGDNSDFYRRFWSSPSTERRAASLYPDLDGLPIVSKKELRPHADGFPLASFRGRSLKVQTSGSTGTPMTFVRSTEQESWFWGLRIRCWQWAGYDLGEPYLALNLNRRDAWKKRLQDHFFRCWYLTYDVNTQDSRHICSLLASRQITHINAFGSTLFPLAQYMKRHGIPNPGVRVLTSTGDNLYPAQRELIERVFGVPVTDYYGAGGEGMHLASQCENHDRYHVHMENSILEIIKDGRPALPGEVGSIVVTQLDNYAMPLVRYDLGDLATAADEQPCPCGRAHETIASINGRACDLIYAPSGAVLLPQFFFIGPFKTLSKVARYQVVQERSEEVTIKLVAKRGCDHLACETMLSGYIADATQGTLEVRFDWVSDIPLSGLGKPRTVVSRLSMAGQAERRG